MTHQNSPLYGKISETLPVVAAIDGGGSKTLQVVLRCDGVILDIARAGGSNPFDQPLWRETLSGLFARLPRELAAIGMGLAGFGESVDLNSRQRALISDTFSQTRVALTNDVDMACNGAFGGREGVLILSGTGSMAWARDIEGRNCRVGGWGALMGDEGSAYWIGRKALALITAILDGRNTTDTDFLPPFQEVLNLPPSYSDSSAALLDWYASLTHERSAVALLTQIVALAAEEGCVAAGRIMSDAAAELALHIRTARRKLERPALPWSYAGGTLKSGYLRNLITELCGVPQAPLLPPIGGGLLTAATEAGWHVDDVWIRDLGRNLEAAGLGN